METKLNAVGVTKVIEWCAAAKKEGITQIPSSKYTKETLPVLLALIMEEDEVPLQKYLLSKLADVKVSKAEADASKAKAEASKAKAQACKAAAAASTSKASKAPAAPKAPACMAALSKAKAKATKAAEVDDEEVDDVDLAARLRALGVTKLSALCVKAKKELTGKDLSAIKAPSTWKMAEMDGHIESIMTAIKAEPELAVWLSKQL